jgi:hypothetical protein
LWGRQELYCLRHTSSFFVGSCFLLRSVCTIILLFHASCSYWHGRHIPPCPSFSTEMQSQAFFPGLACNFYHPVSLLCSMGWQLHTTAPSYWLKWGLANFLPGFLRVTLPTCLPGSWDYRLYHHAWFVIWVWFY